MKHALAAVLAAAGLVGGLSGCGKKGPPLPPLVRIPVAPEMRAYRRGPTIQLDVIVPNANTDGTRPANIDRLEVYAATDPPPTTSDDDVVKHWTRVGSIAVKSPRNPNDAIEPDEPRDNIDPLVGEGLDQGAVARVQEVDAAALATVSEPDLPLVGPSGPASVRTYVGVGVNLRGRKGRFSKRVAVSLATAPPAPLPPTVTYTETAITVAWTSPYGVDAPAEPRQEVARAVEPARNDDENQDQDEDHTPRRPLPARPIRLPGPALTYNVYDGTTGALLTAMPVAEPRFVDNRMDWGAKRCYVVVSVETIGGLPVESPAREPRCETLVDTFPPAAPKGLNAVATEGAISLIWEPNKESDLAGYIILRAPAPATRLDVIVPTPYPDTSYVDGVPPGAHYVYAVEAVDRAGNVSPPSNRADATAR